MNRSVAWTGSILLLFGVGLFVYRFWVLGMPLLPTDPEGVWQVEMDVTLRGRGPGALEAALPSNDSHQIIFDETSSSEGLDLVIDHEGPGRLGVWSGELSGIHRIAYAFRVRLTGERFALASAPVRGEVPKSVTKAYLKSTPETPAASKEVAQRLESLGLPPSDDPSGRLRTIFAFVDHQITTVDEGTDDALLTMVEREGSPRGKARLMVTLLRAAEIPARLVAGLRLEERRSPDRIHWVECWINEGWVSVSAQGDFFAERPKDVLQLRYEDDVLIEPTKVFAMDSSYSALRQRLSPRDLANMMIPENPFFAAVSLYRLPVPTQKALRLLLLLPLGALMVSLYRNLVGFRTFGTFMPILIALALRETSLQAGLLILGLVVGLGVVTRRFLEGLRLLVVPRISLLLCLVILLVLGVSLVAEEFDQRDLVGSVFPLVVITMLIERLALVIAEEGTRNALSRAFSSIVIAVLTYPVFRSTVAEHLMFGFPELVIAIMGCLVFIGGYTGFRATDYVRFRILGQGGESIPSEIFGIAPETEGKTGAP
ncbi:MAG: UUP1 family membrane protein [Myxococcota bacterium]